MMHTSQMLKRKKIKIISDLTQMKNMKRKKIMTVEGEELVASLTQEVSSHHHPRAQKNHYLYWCFRRNINTIAYQKLTKLSHKFRPLQWEARCHKTTRTRAIFSMYTNTRQQRTVTGTNLSLHKNSFDKNWTSFHWPDKLDNQCGLCFLMITVTKKAKHVPKRPLHKVPVKKFTIKSLATDNVQTGMHCWSFELKKYPTLPPS